MKVKITETVLRDSQQSLIATRMPFSDFEGILETLDNAGYYSLECWGGATFDSCLRYLDEDPWERLRKIKAVCKKTPLQMLIRGQNILGYKHYPDDVVRLFCRKAAENGMDIFRIFDALNDFRNIEVCIDEVKKCGKHAQGCICYTTSPVHTIEKYVEMCKELVNMGVDSIAIKDMAGICSPKEAYDLVKAIKDANISVPLFFHTHHTTGMGPMTLMKAIEAGVDGIDCAISTMAGGTSQPCTETMAYTMGQFGYESGLDTDKLKQIADFFVPVRKKFLDDGTLNPTVLGIKADILKYQVPGGMLSNMIANLKDMKALDKFDEALAEIPAVRKDMGYPRSLHLSHRWLVTRQFRTYSSVKDIRTSPRRSRLTSVVSTAEHRAKLTRNSSTDAGSLKNSLRADMLIPLSPHSRRQRRNLAIRQDPTRMSSPTSLSLRLQRSSSQLVKRKNPTQLTTPSRRRRINYESCYSVGCRARYKTQQT